MCLSQGKTISNISFSFVRLATSSERDIFLWLMTGGGMFTVTHFFCFLSERRSFFTNWRPILGSRAPFSVARGSGGRFPGFQKRGDVITKEACPLTSKVTSATFETDERRQHATHYTNYIISRNWFSFHVSAIAASPPVAWRERNLSDPLLLGKAPPLAGAAERGLVPRASHAPINCCSD